MHIKAAHKMLMKMTPAIDFINILCTAFAPADPESIKDTDDLTVFFTLSKSSSVKAARKTLVKLTPGWDYPCSTSTYRSTTNLCKKSFF